jgi:hypothetical protein
VSVIRNLRVRLSQRWGRVAVVGLILLAPTLTVSSASAATSASSDPPLIELLNDSGANWCVGALNTLWWTHGDTFAQQQGVESSYTHNCPSTGYKVLPANYLKVSIVLYDGIYPNAHVCDYTGGPAYNANQSSGATVYNSAIPVCSQSSTYWGVSENQVWLWPGFFSPVSPMATLTPAVNGY